jgi:hypothetical protein
MEEPRATKNARIVLDLANAGMFRCVQHDTGDHSFHSRPAGLRSRRAREKKRATRVHFLRHSSLAGRLGMDAGFHDLRKLLAELELQLLSNLMDARDGKVRIERAVQIYENAVSHLMSYD